MPGLDTLAPAILFSIAILVLTALIAYWGAFLLRRKLDDEARRKLIEAGKAQRFVWLPDGIAHARYYRAQGSNAASAPIVVLIHGFSTPSFVWHDHIEPLTRAGFRVLTYDHFGRGFSARPRRKYDTGLLDRQLDSLLDAFDLKEPVHLAGYSMGGAVATIFAARHPERVASLTLIAPAGLGVAPQGGAMALLRAPVIGDWLVRIFGPRLFGKGAAREAANAPDPAGFVNSFRQQLAYRGYGEALLSTIRHYPLSGAIQFYEEAGKAGRPVLVVWGEADSVVPFTHAPKLVNLMPQATLYSYPNIGHDIAYSQAPLVSGLMTQFLTGLRGSGATLRLVPRE